MYNTIATATGLSFKLNINGTLNKTGENLIFSGSKEVIKFGVGTISNGNMYLSGGFLSLYPGKGFGKATIKFLFNRLPRINTIILKCKDNVLPFWKKAGGKISDRLPEYNVVTIYRYNVR